NFDILDNKGAKIRGIYVYELSTSLAFQGTNKRGENDEREQMTEALQADDNATFSISFSALDPKRMVAIKGGLRDRDNMPIKVPRGKVLHVDDISRDGGGKELDPIIPLVRR
ncbi:MAG: hypothetical protein KGH71_06530, partial [Candidatus Micrarchaeota archaeon]|nr:hypothetical protein [Candidatus Micrarchaeota archaeon]